MTAADCIAEWLAGHRVSHAFGLVGAGILPIWDAITRLGKTQIICCHHEQAAATAAASMNRLDYRLRAIALVTSGGGAANAITGVMGAHMDSIPLIIISGNEPSKYLTAGTRVLGVQGFNAARVAEPFTKVSLTLGEGNLEGTLATIWLAATEPRSGAAWLDCPRNKQSESI